MATAVRGHSFRELWAELSLLWCTQVPVTNYIYSPIPLYILYNSKGIQHPICTAVR